MSQKDYFNEKLPKDTNSYWRAFQHTNHFDALAQDIEVDVCVVGGGITGITSAYLLAKEGLSVALLEADDLISGTTGHTTAKITAQHDLIYDELITNLGKSKAKLYYESNIQALQFIKNTIHELQIDCELSHKDAYLYATTEEYARKVKKEYEAYQTLGVDGKLVDTIPLNLEIENAVMMRDQAQFHPVKYLIPLIEKIKEMGGLIFENTTAVKIKEEQKPKVLTDKNFQVTSQYVLSCTHFPFYEGLGLYSTRMYADRSYVIAGNVGEVQDDFLNGIYISADQPTRSMRSVTIDNEEMVLIVGESHKTGQGKDTMKHYKALQTFGEEQFDIKSIPYRWSAQDLTTLDKVPYIGEITPGQPHILIATGYRKWGMSNGTVAALLLSDIVLDKKNAFKELYTPSRFNATPSIKNFLTQNMDVAGHLIKGKLEKSDFDPKDLNNDEGAVVTINGERKGAYRDEEGALYIVDTTCTHVGCEVEWNNGEKTWDCPCHGSRFSFNGDVLEGPAEKPLQKHDYKMLDNLISKDSGY